jgi:hypothetical protein
MALKTAIRNSGVWLTPPCHEQAPCLPIEGECQPSLHVAGPITIGIQDRRTTRGTVEPRHALRGCPCLSCFAHWHMLHLVSVSDNPHRILGPAVLLTTWLTSSMIAMLEIKFKQGGQNENSYPGTQRRTQGSRGALGEDRLAHRAGRRDGSEG